MAVTHGKFRNRPGSWHPSQEDLVQCIWPDLIGRLRSQTLILGAPLPALRDMMPWRSNMHRLLLFSLLGIFCVSAKAVNANKGEIPMIAVMPLSGVGVDATSSLVATDALSDELLKTGSVRVMERSQMENILKEQGFQQSGACDGSECAVQVGKLLSVEKIVVGTFGKIGNSYSLSFRLVDVQTGEILRSVHRMQHGAIDQVVVDVFPAMAAELAARSSDTHEAVVKHEPRSAPPEPNAKMTSTQWNAGTLIDPRDHREYRWVKIGSQTWMAQNLNYDAPNSWCYDDSASNCARYGRLYSWGDMESENSGKGLREVCPGGWHVPSDSEWDMLIVTVGGSATAGINLKAKSGSDLYDFSVLPAGIRSSHGKYARLGNSSVFWSSSEEGASTAGTRFFDSDSRLFRNNDKKTFGFSVRCVMNKE